jgi:IS5 family transposase
MKTRNNTNPSLTDTVYDLGLKKVLMTFLNQVDKLIDWDKVRSTIEMKYTKGANIIGDTAYNCVLLFKILLLQQWYNLSDPDVEEDQRLPQFKTFA